MLQYAGFVHNDPDGLWIEFPDFPEISGTQGNNMNDLVRMAEDCLGGYLEILLEEGKEIPEPSNIEGENIIYITIPPDISVPITIHETRKKLGLTQADVAKKMGVSYRTLQNVELKMRSPSVKTLNRIAHAMGKKLIIDMV